jgi:UDP-N-acetylglucosamine diphosphorylase/glucosamine-1-phosphate N-acetyltransferase
MRVCLFEDAPVADLEPLCLTRPAFELLCGCTTLGEKQYRHFGATSRGAIVRPELAEATQVASPEIAVNDVAWLRSGPVVLVNARWLPPAGGVPTLPDTPCVALGGGEVAYAVLVPGELTTCSLPGFDAALERWKHTLPEHEAGGRMLRYLWDLVDANAAEVERDAWLTGPERPRRTEGLPAVVGPADRLVIDPTARIDPMVVADTTGGTVVIDRDAVVTAFSRLEGPCYVGPGTQMLGAKVRAGTSLGPHCRVGGEVECSVLLGWSNKYHDGFLGHAYVGAWVNLGAGTSNSDLRNDYGSVRVTVRGRDVDSGRAKVGCFLGDHTKTGLGALLNTGTSAGVFCNLLPTGGLLPKCVPSFTNVWNGTLRENADLDSLLKTAGEVMHRRGVVLDEAHGRLYRQLWDQTASARRRSLREAEMRRLRRSA